MNITWNKSYMIHLRKESRVNPQPYKYANKHKALLEIIDIRLQASSLRMKSKINHCVISISMVKKLKHHREQSVSPSGRKEDLI